MNLQSFNLTPYVSQTGAKPRCACRGVTFIELCITLGIVSILFAMALFLAQHVNAITKIRRAQAELAYWHTAIDDWFVKYGEYPSFDMRRGDNREDCNLCNKAYTTGTVYNLAEVASNACVRIDMGDGNYIYEYFSQYIVGAPNTVDPWGTPYLYIPADEDPDDNISNPRVTYQLLSCGPDGKSFLKGDDPKTERDDVYFGH